MKSRSCRTLAIAIALVGAAPAAAWAEGWYFAWSCSENCAPYSPGADSLGPYETEAECDYAQQAYGKRSWEIDAVNVDNDFSVHTCEHVGGSAGGSSGISEPKVRIDRNEFGVDLGRGWTTTQAGVSTQSPYAVGIDEEVHTGRDWIGAVLLVGFHVSQVSAPALGAGDHTYAVVPVTLGLRLTPRIAHGLTWAIRLNLAASHGGFMQLACAGCADGSLDDFIGFGYRLKAGVDIFFSQTSGLGLAVLFDGWSMTDSTSGVEVRSPAWMARVSWIVRPGF